MTESISSSNALTVQNPAERKSPFLTREQLSPEKKSPFLERKELSDDKSSPLEIQREEDKKNSNTEGVSFDLPKDKGTILAELRRNAMHYMMTARDIANEYGIPYIQAQDIYTSLNEDSNGIVREYKLPENSTESFLV